MFVGGKYLIYKYLKVLVQN